jgi:hypothetical protein
MKCTMAVICACTLLGWAAGARAAALATVVSVKGAVQVTHKGRSRPAEVGLGLEAGDTVITKKAGTVWLVHRSGRLEKVGPGRRLALADKAAPERGRLASLLRGLGLFGAPETGKLGNVGGGIRPGRQQTFFVRSPRQSHVRYPVGAIRWTPHPKTAHYQVRVASVDKDLVTRRTSEPRLDLGELAAKLPRGKLCFLTVEARSKRNKVLAKDQTTFTVASEQAQQELDKTVGELRQGFAEERFGARLVLAELYLRKAFYADALELFQELHQQMPKNPWLARRVKATRQAMGLPPEK